MKKLFTAIRQGNLDEVTRILDKNPDLISCLAKASCPLTPGRQL